MAARLLRFQVIVTLASLLACRDKAADATNSGRATLPPIFPKGPSTNANWDASAGSILLASVGNIEDSAEIVLPDVTDSTIAFLHDAPPPLTGVRVDLFGRSGKLASGVSISPLSGVDTTDGCYTWPAARIKPSTSGWQVAFVTGHVTAMKLDSIETLSSVDSAGLAADLTRSAATIPATSDPVFRGLPFRVRSAYQFSFDSVDAVIADIVRSVNEEATPRLEQLLLIGEKPRRSAGKYSVVYYNRTAGAEESTQVTEVLAMISIGSPRHPAAVISVVYNDGGRLGLLERTGASEWRTTWRSAYTGCD